MALGFRQAAESPFVTAFESGDAPLERDSFCAFVVEARRVPRSRTQHAQDDQASHLCSRLLDQVPFLTVGFPQCIVPQKKGPRETYVAMTSEKFLVSVDRNTE